MTACKDCEKTLGGGHWEKCTVIKREPVPSDYFAVPTRTWLLQAGGVKAYMTGTSLYCPACYEALAAKAG